MEGLAYKESVMNKTQTRDIILTIIRNLQLSREKQERSVEKRKHHKSLKLKKSISHQRTHL